MPAHHASGIIFDGVGLHHAPSLYSSVSAPAYICPSDKAPPSKQKHPLLNGTLETASVQPAPFLSADSTLAALFLSGSLRQTSARHIRPSRTKDRLRLTTKRKRGAPIFRRFSLQDRCSPRCIHSDNDIVETWSVKSAEKRDVDFTLHVSIMSLSE